MSRSARAIRIRVDARRSGLLIFRMWQGTGLLRSTLAGMAMALVFVAGCGGRMIRLGVQSDSGGTDGGGAGSETASTCLQHGQVKATEVLWIGDTWAYLPGSQQTHLLELARAAGALGQDEKYVSLAAASKTMADITNQYNSREAGATKVKVVLMDGGTWDTITGQAALGTAVAKAADGFKQFLAKVASDGTVEHVVYFLCPEHSTIPGVKELRPLMKSACAQSTVPCHFLDLQDTWAGHPEYIDTSISLAFPTPLGGQDIAEKIWGIMQANCIAQ